MNGTRTAQSGIDAYEISCDMVTTNLGRVLAYNTLWFAGTLAVLGLLLLTTVLLLRSWPVFFASAVIMVLILSPIWEAANIVRFGHRVPAASGSAIVFVKVVLARLLFLLLVGVGYLALLLPGIYLHCRLCLYVPLLVRNPNLSPTESLRGSWKLTESRFLSIYTLWIAVVVSKPVCFLPFGLGFVLERPIAALAKDQMLASLTSACLPRFRGSST